MANSVSYHPIIILEGPDGSGKTTLAKAIAAKYHPTKIIHLTYRFKNQMDNYHTAAMELALRLSREYLVVLDRWWPSESIYAGAYRGGTNWPTMGRTLERVALKHGFTQVMCLPSDRELYLTEFQILKGERPEMYDEGMDRVYQGYRDFAMKMGIWDDPELNGDWMLYDRHRHCSDSYIQAFAEKVIDQATENTMCVPDFVAPIEMRDFCGQSMSPRVLFIGEKTISQSRRAMWPFFSVKGSCRWLTQCLAHHCLPERALAYTNVYNREGVLNNIPAIIEAVDPVKIVALGRTAEKILYRQRVGINLVLPHPEQVKRFLQGDFAEYKHLTHHYYGDLNAVGSQSTLVH